jgi:glycosyltransferase involved in cell wall biosynthesis
MSPLRISLVTPCLNNEAFLQETFESVAAQEAVVEHIVVDGGSTDETLSIIQANKAQIAKVIQEPDTGMYDALSKGFEAGDGEIMGWINGDDVYFPGALKTVTEIFTQLPEVEWISTLNPVAIDDSGYLFKVRKIAGFSRQAFVDGIYVGFDGLSNPYASDFIQQESTFWRRSLWEKLGPDPIAYYRSDRRQAGDFGLWCLFAGEADLYGVEAPLCAWRMHGAQFTDAQPYMDEVEIALDKLRSKITYTAPNNPPGDFAKYVGKYITKTESSGWKGIEDDFYVLPNSDIKKAIGLGRLF